MLRYIRDTSQVRESVRPLQKEEMEGGSPSLFPLLEALPWGNPLLEVEVPPSLVALALWAVSPLLGLEV